LTDRACRFAILRGPARETARRMRSSSFASLIATLALAGSGIAAAEPSLQAHADRESAYAIGFRVGGYGFHSADASQTSDWNNCRMNGIGVFADRALPGPLFLEAGLDTYFSAGQAPSSDLPIDRQNVLVSVAAGARVHVTSWLAGYVQLGTGAELARVSVPYGGSTIATDKVLPDAFLGFGGDVRLGRHTVVGATMRMHVMRNFDYDPSRLQMSNPWVAEPSPSDVFSTSPALAAQAQFYLRRDL
jgi:hypothetical protein